MNGVLRGGYYGVQTVERQRSGYRYIRNRVDAIAAIGFRTVNGVIRGVSTWGNADRVRGGYRFGGYKRYKDYSDLGFRLNGVNRGGSYTQWNLVSMFRSGGLRQQYVRSHPLGFRSGEWCMEEWLG